MYVSNNLLKQFEINVNKKLGYLKEISDHHFNDFIEQVHVSFIEWFDAYFNPINQPFVVNLF